MELQDRLNVLVQSAQLAQNKGILSLEDAVVVKTAIDNIQSNKDIETSIKILIHVAQLAQSKGCYTLKDAHVIYVVIDGILDVLNKETPVKENKNKKGEK